MNFIHQLLLIFLLCSKNFLPGILCCQLMINEVNIDSPNTNENNEFIELIKTACDGSDSINLQEFAVIVVKEYEDGKQNPIIVFSADLSHSKFSSNSIYFVIGSALSSGFSNLAFDSQNVVYRGLKIYGGKRRNKNVKFTDVIENGNKYPMAIILLQQVNRWSTSLSIDKVLLNQGSKLAHTTVEGKVIDGALEQVIKQNLRDIYIYSRRSYLTSCGFFQRLLPQFSKINIGTEFDVQGYNDVSVNRCPTRRESVTTLFALCTFKIGKKTPNALNDCTGFHFILQDSMPEIMKSEISTCSKPVRLQPNSCGEVAFPCETIAVHSVDIANYRECKILQSSTSLSSDMQACPCTPGIVDATFNRLLQQEQAVTKKLSKTRSTTSEPLCNKVFISADKNDVVVKPWESENHFQNEWIQQIKQYQSEYISSKILTKEHHAWLQYIFNKQNPSLSTFQCRFCASYLRKHPQAKNPPLLASVNGFFARNYLRMYKQITEHSSCFMHRTAMREMQEEHLSSLKQCSNRLLDTSFAQCDDATQKIIRTVYTETKLNIPFDSHSDMVKFQQLNGIDLGYHHHDRMAAARILHSISEKMHQTLISYLLDDSRPLSFMADTSTDVSNRNYLLVYIRSIEHNKPTTYFYRCIRLNSETSESLKDMIVAMLKEDNMYTAFVSQAHSFLTDGAPVMIKFGKLLNDITKNDMFRMHCFTHKLQLAVSRALNSVKEYKSNMDSFLNSVFSFFNNKAFTCKSSLVKTAEILGDTYYELHYIKSIRWVAHEVTSFISVFKMYPSISENLQSLISTDSTDIIAANAQGLLSTLHNSRFFTMFLFLMDVLKTLQEVSLKLQDTTCTLMEANKILASLLTDIDLFRLKNGHHLQHLVDNALCHSQSQWIKCNLELLDAVEFKYTINSHELLFKPLSSRTESIWSALGEVRVKLIDSLVMQLRSYLPDTPLDLFDVLIPSKLPLLVSEIPIFALKIAPLARRFGFDATTATNEFQELLTTIITNYYEQYCSLRKNEKAFAFWTYFLQHSMITWPNSMRKLMHIVLSIPVSSADVERGFSVMNHFKIARRKRLTDQHIEDTLRIRINGPSIDTFDAKLYALHWLNTQHFESGDSRKSKDVENSDEENDGKESTLF